MTNTSIKYRFSFTAGALHHEEMKLASDTLIGRTISEELGVKTSNNTFEAAHALVKDQRQLNIAKFKDIWGCKTNQCLMNNKEIQWDEE